MEVSITQLQDHQNKCRCCFRTLKSTQKTVEISKSISQRFLSLTNIKLVIMDCYSCVICESCNSKLSEFADFQNELIENQMMLYEHYPCSEVTDQEIVAGDTEEILVEEDDLMEETQLIKIEEIPYEEPFSTSLSQSLVVKQTQQALAFQEWDCKQCRETFSSRSLLRIHMKIHSEFSNSRKSNDGKRKTCELCGLSFAVNGWYHHILRAHTVKDRFQCDFCGKGFKVKNDIKEHMNIHMSLESRPKFPCESCGTFLLSKSALRNHNQIFHQDYIEEHPCDCGKVFASKMKLYQHRTTVHVKGHYPCTFCDKSYTVKGALQKHIIKHHQTKVSCEVCGKMYAPGIHLNRHMMSHGEPSNQCKFEGCSKVYCTKTALKNHVESHHESNTTVKCPTCNSSFTTVRNLNRHIARQHNNSFRVQCAVEDCSHSSNRKDYLVAHYRSHKDIDEETRTELIAKVKEIKDMSW